MKREQDGRGHRLQEPGLKHKFQERFWHLLFNIYTETVRMPQAVTMMIILINFIQVFFYRSIFDSLLWYRGSFIYLYIDAALSGLSVVLFICVMIFDKRNDSSTKYFVNQLQTVPPNPSRSIIVTLLAYLLRIVALMSTFRLTAFALALLFNLQKAQTHICILTGISSSISLAVSIVYFCFIENYIPTNSFYSASTNCNLLCISISPGFCMLTNAWGEKMFRHMGSQLDYRIYLFVIGKAAIHFICAGYLVTKSVFFNKKAMVPFALLHIATGVMQALQMLIVYCKSISASFCIVVVILEFAFMAKLFLNYKAMLTFYSLNKDSLDSVLRVLYNVRSSVGKGFEKSIDYFFQSAALNVSDRSVFVHRLFERIVTKNSPDMIKAQLIYLNYLLESSTSPGLKFNLYSSIKQSKLGHRDAFVFKIIASKMQASFFGNSSQPNFQLETKSTQQYFADKYKDQSRTSKPDFISPAIALTTYKTYDLLAVVMHKKLTELYDFYDELTESLIRIPTLHEIARKIAHNKKLPKGLFRHIEESSGQFSVFHLLPYARFMQLTRNEGRLVKELSKLYQNRSRTKTVACKADSNSWHSKENEIVLSVSLEQTSFGKITYSSKFSTVLMNHLYGTSKEVIGNNISSLFSEDAARLHMKIMVSYLDTLNKPYLGLKHPRHIKSIGSRSYTKATVTSVLQPNFLEGVLSVILIEPSRYTDYFIVVNSELNIIGASQRIACIEDCVVNQQKYCSLQEVSADLFAKVSELTKNTDQTPDRAQIRNRVSSKRYGSKVPSGGTSSATLKPVDSNLPSVYINNQIAFSSSSLGKQSKETSSKKLPQINSIKISKSKVVFYHDEDILINSETMKASSSTAEEVTQYFIYFRPSLFRSTDAHELLPNNAYLKKAFDRISEESNDDFIPKQSEQPIVEVAVIKSSTSNIDRKSPYESKIGKKHTAIFNRTQKIDKDLDFHEIEVKQSYKIVDKKVVTIQKLSVMKNIKLEIVTMISIFVTFWLGIIFTNALQYFYISTAISNLIKLRQFVGMGLQGALSCLQSVALAYQGFAIAAGLQQNSKYDIIQPMLDFQPWERMKYRLDQADHYLMRILEYNTNLKDGNGNITRRFTYTTSLALGVGVNQTFTGTYDYYRFHLLAVQELKLVRENRARLNANSSQFLTIRKILEIGTQLTGSRTVGEIINVVGDAYLGKKRQIDLFIYSTVGVNQVLAVILIVAMFRYKNKLFRIYYCFRSLDEVEIQFKKDRLEHLSEAILDSVSTKNFAHTYNSGQSLQQLPQIRSMKQGQKTAGTRRMIMRKHYFFGLGVAALAFIAVMELRIIFISIISTGVNARQLRINDFMVNFRQVSRLNFLATRLHIMLYDALMIRTGYNTKMSLKEVLAVMESVNNDMGQTTLSLMTEYFEKMTESEKKSFDNLEFLRRPCRVVDMSSTQISVDRCEYLFDGSISKGIFPQFQWLKLYFGNAISRIRLVTDASGLKSMFMDKDFRELDFVVNELIWLQFLYFNQDFQIGISSFYKDVKLMILVIIITNTAAVMGMLSIAMGIVIYRINSGMEIALNVLRSLPSSSIDSNASVKMMLKSVGAVVN